MFFLCCIVWKISLTGLFSLEAKCLLAFWLGNAFVFSFLNPDLINSTVLFSCVYQVSVLVMCHTRELAFQISKEYERFSKYMPTVKVSVFFGGMAIKKDEEVLKKNCPHIVVGTPGRTLALIRNKTLSVKNIKHFVLDECDKMLEQLGERNRSRL